MAPFLLEYYMETSIFDHEAFSLSSLITAYNTSTVFEDDVLKMFDVESVESRTVHLIKSGSTLQVLMPGEIGNNPNVDSPDSEEGVPVTLIRYPFENKVLPKDLERIGSLKDKKIKARELAVVVKQRMGRHRDNHRYTALFTCYTALKGIIKDKKGNEKVNLFTLLGVKQKKLDFKLGTKTTDIPQMLQAYAKQTKQIAKSLGHSTLKGIDVRWGQSMIERLLAHDSVKEFYGDEEHAKLRVKFADDPSSINMCGIRFVTDEADEVAEEGAGYPVGVHGLWAMLRAPADVMSGSSANKRECHITKEPLRHDEGLEIRSRSIYLPICRAPQLLCALYSSD